MGGARPVYARPQPTENGVGLVCIREVPAGATVCSCDNMEAYRKIWLHPAEQTFYNELFDPQDVDGSY